DLVSVSSTTVGWLAVNVTNHVQGQVSGAYSNFGWSILHQNEGVSGTQYITVRSMDYSGTTYDPRLVVNYYVPIVITDATITNESAPGASDGSITPILSGGPGGTYSYQWENAGGAVVGTSLNLGGVPGGWYGLRVTSSV